MPRKPKTGSEKPDKKAPKPKKSGDDLDEWMEEMELFEDLFDEH